MAKSETTILARVEDFQTPKEWLARVLYAFNLFELRKEEGYRPTYGCTLVFPIAARPFFGEKIAKLIKDSPGATWGEKGLARFKENLIKNPLLKGDGKEAHDSKTGEIKPGFGADTFFIRPSSGEKFPPFVRGKNPNLPGTQDEVYSGCYGRAVLSMYSYNHPKSGDGISINISGFQKWRDGDRLGGGAPADPDKWVETIADDGDAPDATKTGAGAAELFGE